CHARIPLVCSLTPFRADSSLDDSPTRRSADRFRTESRAAHGRFDFPDRDDETWLSHTLYLPESESMTRRSVNMEPKLRPAFPPKDRKSTRLNSSHVSISYAVFSLQKKTRQ